MSELLRLENIQKTYPMGNEDVHVLKGISLSIHAGEFVAIMGASGSGKSTLLHIAGALDRPGPVQPTRIGKGESYFAFFFWLWRLIANRILRRRVERKVNRESVGEVYFRGKKLSQMRRRERHRLRNREFGFVFQLYHLLPELNVLENVLLPSIVDTTPRWLIYGLLVPGAGLAVLGLLTAVIALFFTAPTVFLIGSVSFLLGLFVLVATGIAVFITDFVRLIIRRTAKKPEALQLLNAFGLSHRLKHRPAELSGGERQRVAIARALINQPALLLADEPTGNLDAATGRAILDVLVKLHKTRGQTILMVTHDPNVAALADRTIRLSEGRIQK